MVFRIFGLVLSLGLVGYLLYSVLISNSKIDQSINSNPAVQEQQKTLKDATGVDPANKKELKKYLNDQAKQLDEYEHQADNLPKDPP